MPDPTPTEIPATDALPEPALEPPVVVSAPDAPEPAAPATTIAAEQAAAAPGAEAPAPVAVAGPAEMSPAACAARLAELFPALFGMPPKPIKLRIQADIQQRAPGVFTRKSLSIFLHRHTTSTAYLKGLAQHPQRFDLDGAPAGELLEEHRQAAIAELERRRAMFEARRAEQRQTQREAARAARQSQPAAAPDGTAAPAARTGAPPRPPRHDRARAEPRPAARSQPSRPPRQEARTAPAPSLSAEDQARRDRAALLRAYESSTLTRANFCVLKRISEAELDAQLVQARQEAAAWAKLQPAPRAEPQHDERGARRAPPRPRARGDR